MCFVHCLYVTGPAIFDYNKRLIQLTVIPLNGGHCITYCILLDLPSLSHQLSFTSCLIQVSVPVVMQLQNCIIEKLTIKNDPILYLRPTYEKMPTLENY
jgi:hypothetical protein